MLGKLVQRAGRASLPYLVERVAGVRFLVDIRERGKVRGEGARRVREGRTTPDLFAIAALSWGSVVVFACVVGLAYARHRVVLAALAASGFCWGALVRGNVVHSHEGLFFVGFSLVFFSVALLQARRVSERSIGVCAGAALLVFVLSNLQMNRSATAAEAHDFRTLIADYEAIRGVASEGAVIVSRKSRRREARFFLTGRIFVDRMNGRQHHRAHFALCECAPDSTGLLTPDNRWVCLFDRAALHATRSGG